jgi:hypothetical protein
MMQAGRSLVGPAHWLCPDPHHSFWPCQLFRQAVASGYYSSCCHCSLPALLVIQSRERGRLGHWELRFAPFPRRLSQFAPGWPGRPELWWPLCAHSSPSGTSRLSRRTLFALKSSAGATTDPRTVNQIGQEGKEGRLARQIERRNAGSLHHITKPDTTSSGRGGPNRAGTRLYNKPPLLLSPSRLAHPTTLAKASTS